MGFCIVGWRGEIGLTCGVRFVGLLKGVTLKREGLGAVEEHRLEHPGTAAARRDWPEQAFTGRSVRLFAVSGERSLPAIGVPQVTRMLDR
jgi:hypothetical protein